MVGNTYINQTSSLVDAIVDVICLTGYLYEDGTNLRQLMCLDSGQWAWLDGTEGESCQSKQNPIFHYTHTHTSFKLSSKVKMLSPYLFGKVQINCEMLYLKLFYRKDLLNKNPTKI